MANSPLIMARNRKSNLELLMPGASGWCRWSGQENSGCTLEAEFGQGAAQLVARVTRARQQGDADRGLSH